MSSLSHYCGADLALDSAGGLAIASDALDTRQRILRRLCTNEGGYIWNLGYGAGLPGRIGDPMQIDRVQGIVQSQMALESGVDQTQPVSVAVTAQGSGQYLCVISYTDARTNTAQTVSVTG